MAWRQTGRRQTGRRQTGRRQIGRRQPDTYPQDPTNIQVTHVPFQVSKCMKHAQLAFLLFRLSVTITIINIIFLQIKMFLKFGRGNIFPLLKQGETVRLRFLHANAAAESGTQKGPIGNEPSLIPRNSIPKDELGFSLINPEANKSIRKGVLFAKVCSLTSSSLGLIMIPIISSSFSEALADRPGVAAFMAVADCFLVFFALTPFLLHFLTKRFVNEIYFNPEKKVFTTVHYNFLLQKRALRFTADEVEDPMDAQDKNKFSLQLATCSVRSYPLLLLLEPEIYTDQEVYRLLTKNIKTHNGQT